MSNYSKTTDFEAKDSLPTGDSGKIIRGAEFETEFDAISTAIATKADTAGPTFTGTLTFETISDGTIGVTAFVDEDDMSSDSATLVPTQQSVKAYVDSQVTAQDLDFQADTGGALSIDLDSETLTFTGGTGIDTSGLGNAVTFAIDSTVATLTGTQTLTNKTLTSPDVNTPDIDGGTIDGTVIGGTTPAAVSATTVSATGNITVGGTVDGRDVATDGTKLDGIESGATADQTAAEIRTLVEAATDSNVFTDADHTKLDGIEAGATGDQTNAEIRAAVEAATDSNVFTDADHSKLDGIEALADVTDTTNVTAAGALMDSELTNITAVKALDQGVATTDTPTFAGLATSANVTFGDNDKAVFGAGSDLQIYHDGTNSYIDDTSSGNLVLRGNPAVSIQKYTGEVSGVFNADGAVNLYYDNALKLATTSTGIDVTGTVTADGLTVQTAGVNYLKADQSLGSLMIQTNGANNRAFFSHNGDVSLYEDTGTTAKFFWDASAERLGLGTTSPGATLDVDGTLDIAPSSGDAALKILNSQNFGRSLIYFSDPDGIGGRILYNHGNNFLSFETNGTNEAMRIDSSGNVGIGASPDALLRVNGTAKIGEGVASNTAKLMVNTASGVAAGIQLFQDGNESWIIQNPASTTALTFANSGAERMRIDSAGNVGIGTSSPASKLHVNTGSAGYGLTIAANLQTSLTYQMGIDSSSNFAIYDSFAASQRMVIDTNGNVGIGTDSPASGYNNTSALDVSGPILARGAITAHQTNAGVFQYNSNETAIRSYGATSGSGLITFSTGGGGAADTERMRIDSSGNVGIGTDLPAAPLSIAGSSTGEYGALILRNSNSAASGQSTAIIFEASAGTSGDEAASAAKISALRTGGGTTGALLFHTTLNGVSSERLRISSTGSVLAGHTSANFASVGHGLQSNGNAYHTRDGGNPLTVNRLTSDGTIIDIMKDTVSVGSVGTANGNAFILSNDVGLTFAGGNDAIFPTTSAGAYRDAAIDLGGSGQRFKHLHLSGIIYGVQQTLTRDSGAPLELNRTTNDGELVYFKQGGVVRGSISISGSTTSYNTTSDYRLKENVVAMSGATERLKQLNPSRFNFIGDTDTTVDGFLAHEVADIVPEAITGAKDAVDDEGNAVYQGIDQSKLVPLLVATIQELEARIAALESN